MTLLTTARRLIDVWNSKDPVAVRTFYGEAGFADPLVPTAISGIALERYAASIFAAFPDLVFDVRSEAVGESVVMLEWVQKGTHLGSMLGKPASNRYVEIPAVAVLRFDGERLVGHVDYWDLAKLMRDLGFA